MEGQKDCRDYSLKDSIPVHYQDEPKDRLDIKPTLSISNDYLGNYELSQYGDYRNLTLLEYGFKVKELPILINVGREQGSIYNKYYQHYMYNFKIDFQRYIENLRQKTDLTKPIDQFDIRLSEDILKDEIKKQINKEIQKGYSKLKLDSLESKLEQAKSYEKLLNDPLLIQQIQDRKTILREYAMGNKIEGLNYDSLLNIQRDFDAKTFDYNQYIKNPDLTEYRKKYDDILSNKDKAFELKNKTEGRVKSIQNNFRLVDKLSLSRFKINQFNLGQTSADNSTLVFRSFMVNGLSAELNAPIYFQFLYSLPFQTNLFSNYQINSTQNRQVNTLGGAIGISKEKKINAQIGYYRFSEQSGNFNFRPTKPETENQLILLTSKLKTKILTTTIDIAKSESNKYFDQDLFSAKDIQGTTAIKMQNEVELTKTNTQIKLDLQKIGLQYYSSANPFVQRGTGGLISLNQKLGTKLTLKTKTSYRFSEDSNRNNYNFNHSSQLRLKLNRTMSFEGRVIYFQSNIEFSTYYTNITNEIYAIQWNQRIKGKKLTHNLTTILQYQKNKSDGSKELNNSGTNRVSMLNFNYALTASKLSIQANTDNQYHIDSNQFIQNNAVNLQYNLANKTTIGLGGNTQIGSIGMTQLGMTGSFSTTFWKLTVIGSINYQEDRMWNSNRLSPQLRINYKIF